ncbi:hypothetical protein [Cohnella algarum]|uniref:hypothetical protein n=1 Tax=Cohnella algarum TaxID=2044859 RepID=UPI001F08245E|nr:hypothetical protein [Cohnella algarum]
MQLVKIGSIVGSNAKILKQLYVEVPVDRLDIIREELERAGLEVYLAGFVTKSLIACNFRKGAEEAGLETARKLNQAIAGIETPTPLQIGYGRMRARHQRAFAERYRGRQNEGYA